MNNPNSSYSRNYSTSGDSSSSSNTGSNSDNNRGYQGNRSPNYSRDNRSGSRYGSDRSRGDSNGWKSSGSQPVRTNPQSSAAYSNTQNLNQAGGRVSFSSNNPKSQEQRPQELTAGKIRIIPISGQCELGRSCWYFEYDNEIFIMDAGVGFVPHGFKGGVDSILPNTEYLLENKGRIKALVISSPHEEFSANLISFITDLEIPEVFLPPILAELYKDLIPAGTKVNKIGPKQEFKVGKNFTLTAFNAAFSTVDSFSFLIETPKSRIFYTGAFKVDHSTPVVECKTDLQAIASTVTEKGVDLLISSSLNVESPGYTGSEQSVYKRFSEIFSQAKGRVMTITGSCYTHRFKVVIEAAKATGRKVCILGEEVKEWYEAAKKCGYLKFEDSVFVSLDEIDKVPAEKLLILIGTQEGNILRPFIQLAYRNHPHLALREGDTIVVSANPPLGTTRTLANAVDQLFLLGVNVIGGRDAGVHVTGYASQEELKFMYNLSRPKYFLPSHGESRQLVLHAEMLGVCGVNPQNVVIVDNGCVVDFDAENSRADIAGKVPSSAVFFNKSLDGPMNHQSLEERRNLSEDGTLTIAVALDLVGQKLVAGPMLTLFGSSFEKSPTWAEIVQNMKNDIVMVIKRSLNQGQRDVGIIRHQIHDVMSKRIRESFGMSKPVLSIVVQEVSSN
ncbi:MAG: ribonuclease J [Candidatus Caenarcaniphilales bacterium]|nr:ribonuclease J [Candidatus Caenarcaniphilales bacterium]